MADILGNPVEICFVSLTMTSTFPSVVTSPVTAVKIVTTPAATSPIDLASKTHPPKPYDIILGIEHVINMMEETLQICERAQRSTQILSHHKTFPFDLQTSSDVYARQATKSS
jgi:hypothetical protein